LVTAERLVAELAGQRARFEHRNDVEHAQHGEFTERARGQADQLRAAVMLAQSDLYAPAFGCLRIALEHMLVDHLVFLGKRVVQIIDGVDEDTWAEWNGQREAGESFTAIVSWSRTKKGSVEIIGVGVQSERSEGLEEHFLSAHYFLLTQFQPYLGSPSAQPLFDDGISDPAHSRAWATKNEAVYPGPTSVGRTSSETWR
jgi:hypothetical protein